MGSCREDDERAASIVTALRSNRRRGSCCLNLLMLGFRQVLERAGARIAERGRGTPYNLLWVGWVGIIKETIGCFYRNGVCRRHRNGRRFGLPVRGT